MMENNLTVFEQEFGLTVNEEGNVTVGSKFVSEKYGKRHDNVLAKIDGFIQTIPELGLLNFKETQTIDKQNKQSYREYIMDRAGFAILVNKFSGEDALKFTYEYTKAFESMTEELEHRRRQSVEVLNALNEKDIKIQRKKLLESYFGKRKTVNTFKSCNYEEFNNLLSMFEEYLLSIRGSEDKRIEYIRLVNGLTKNRNKINPSDKMYMPKTTTYSYYIQEYDRKKSSSENKSYGQKIRYKDEIIREQQNKLNFLDPDIEEFMIIDKHGMSNNNLYEKIKDKYTNDYKTVRTNTYNNWIKSFPSKQLKPKELLNIDWNKPIIVFLKFDCLESIDVQNLAKSILDQVITREYGEDDNIVEKVIVERNKIVESYKDGKIYICIQNFNC